MVSVFHLVYLMFQEGKGEVVPEKEPTLQSMKTLPGNQCVGDWIIPLNHQVHI